MVISGETHRILQNLHRGVFASVVRATYKRTSDADTRVGKEEPGRDFENSGTPEKIFFTSNSSQGSIEQGKVSRAISLLQLELRRLKEGERERKKEKKKRKRKTRQSFSGGKKTRLEHFMVVIFRVSRSPRCNKKSRVTWTGLIIGTAFIRRSPLVFSANIIPPANFHSRQLSEISFQSACYETYEIYHGILLLLLLFQLSWSTRSERISSSRLEPEKCLPVATGGGRKP